MDDAARQSDAPQPVPSSPPLTLDALIDVVLGMPMCSSSEAGQQSTGKAYRAALFTALDTYGIQSPADRLLAENIKAHVWAAARGFASQRQFFQERRQYRLRTRDNDTAFVRSFAGIDRLNAAGWVPRITIGAGAAALVPTLLNLAYEWTDAAPPIDATTLRTVFEVTAARSALSTSTPLPDELIHRLDDLIVVAAERTIAPGRLATLWHTLSDPRVLGAVLAAVAIAGILAALLDMSMRCYARERLTQIEKTTTDLIDEDWNQTRVQYEKVLVSFMKSVVGALDDRESGLGLGQLQALTGAEVLSGEDSVLAVAGAGPDEEPAHIALKSAGGIDWNSEPTVRVLTALAKASMDVRPPKYDSRKLQPQCLLTIAIDRLNTRVREILTSADAESADQDAGRPTAPRDQDPS